MTTFRLPFPFLLSIILIGTSHVYAAAPQFDQVGFSKFPGAGLRETTGGQGGRVFNVTSSKELEAAVKGSDSKTIYIQGNIALSRALGVGPNTSLLGVGSGATITRSGISIKNVTNVIVRNLKISKILGDDGIEIRNSTRVWIDHNEFESDCCGGGPDKYDGQVDIVRASDWITVSWNYFHDHWKASLVGNSDALRSVDTGHLHVTYHHNYWRHEGTRGPAGRFGTQHVYNNLYVDYLHQVIHSRSDNQVLVEGNVFRGNCTEALSTYGLVIPMDSPNTSVNGDEEIDGYANLGAVNDWGTCKTNITRVGTFTKAPYPYTLTPLAEVEQLVKAGAGIGKLQF
ncbi:pectin lyase-like protein [Trichodelitschia bisporula]|uniref:Pectin lyase-like protein n=1 Tax=Trichodelitschia bisporula TaxID=703511 RepID=A0A6G1I6H2_9PEZI|nr:pectin lyase-like protein [Trichodelitschia bisporula]